MGEREGSDCGGGRGEGRVATVHPTDFGPVVIMFRHMLTMLGHVLTMFGII